MLVQLTFVLMFCYSSLHTADTVQVLTTFQGDQTVLECHCDNNCEAVEWYFVPAGKATRDEILLYSRGSLMTDAASPLNITLLPSNTTGRHGLLITMTTVANAGEYMCNDDMNIEVVVLLDRQLRCVSSSTQQQLAEHDNISFSCELLYVASSAVKAVAVWVDDSRPSVSRVLSHNETVSTVNNTQTRFKTNVVVEAENSRLGPIFCSVYFTLSSVATPSLDTHSLQYSFSSVDVDFAVRNIRINTTTDGVYHIGYKLRCLADGRPAARYQWTEVRPGDMGEQVNSSELVVNTVGRHVYKCTALNVVRGQTHSVTSQVDQLVVLGEPGGKESAGVKPAVAAVVTDDAVDASNWLLPIVVTASLLLLLLLLLVAMLSHRCRSRGRRHVTDDASVSFSSSSSPVMSVTSPLSTPHNALHSLLTQQQTEIYDEIDFKMANKWDKEQLMSDNSMNETKIGLNWTTETLIPDMSRDLHCYWNAEAAAAAAHGSDVTGVYVHHSHCVDCEPRYMEPHSDRNKQHQCTHLPADCSPGFPRLPDPLPPLPPHPPADITDTDGIYLHFN